MTKITAYKGFDANLQCRGFQFEVGQTYTHDGPVSACSSGFHACEAPLDVWGYYPIIQDDGSLTRFAEVEVSGDISRDGNKLAAATITITIKAELRLPDFVKRAVAAIIDATKGKASGDYAQIGASGGYAQIGASGDYAKIDCSGADAVVAVAGPSAKVRGKVGAWVSLASFGEDGKCNGFAVGCIGQDGLLPDTWYRAVCGKLVAA